ncbi:hypothetical protein KW791_03885 [Candidatus Parcubacteria bacterium]|nr:hypothetical protein [Candidatus Parcubacteria bacterium]
MYTRRINVGLTTFNKEEIEIDINESLTKLEKEEGQEPKSCSVVEAKNNKMTLLAFFEGEDPKPKKRQEQIW